MLCTIVKIMKLQINLCDKKNKNDEDQIQKIQKKKYEKMKKC